MKTVIKIVIAVVILNGVARAGMAAASYYQLKDKAQELVTFGALASVGEIQNQILAKAQELNLPIQAGDIDVQRESLHTVARASYTQPVEIFPSYIYPIKFHFTTDAIAMGGLNTTQGGFPVAPQK